MRRRLCVLITVVSVLVVAVAGTASASGRPVRVSSSSVGSPSSSWSRSTATAPPRSSRQASECDPAVDPLADCFDAATRFELHVTGPLAMGFRVPSVHAAGWGWTEHPSCIEPSRTCAIDYSSFRFGLPPGTYTFEGTWYLRGAPSFFPPFTAPTIARTITFTS